MAAETQTGSILITGASNGLGAALAHALAAPGRHLTLMGRDITRLEAVAVKVRARGGTAETAALDVTDAETMRAFVLDLDARAPVDLVIANAGIARAEDAGGRERAAIDTLQTNLCGALFTILPLVPTMASRGRGQIVLMSSLAALAPLPDTPAYSASKAGLLAYGLALREQTRGTGVKVNVVCPGFIRTRMSAQYAGWRPLEMEPEAAAARILRGLDRDQAVIAFPLALAAAARLQGLVPEFLSRLGIGAFRFRISDQSERS